MDHAYYLDLTLEDAELARRDGCAPVGALVVTPDGSILSRGRNRVLSGGDQTTHAEVDAIRNAGAAVAPDRTPPRVLYTSAEPCLLCLGAILYCAIDTVVWAASSVSGSTYDIWRAHGLSYPRPPVLDVVREPLPDHRRRSRALLRAFALESGDVGRAELLRDD